MPNNNNKQSNRGSVGHQRDGEGQGERGDLGNKNRNASGSRREGQPQSQETRRGGTQSHLGGKNNEDDEM